MELPWQFARVAPFLSVRNFLSCRQAKRKWYEEFEKCRYFCFLSPKSLLPLVVWRSPDKFKVERSHSDVAVLQEIRQPWDPSKRLYYACQIGFQWIESATFLLEDSKTGDVCSLCPGREDPQGGFKVRQTRLSFLKSSEGHEKDLILQKHTETRETRRGKITEEAKGEEQEENCSVVSTNGLYFRRGYELRCADSLTFHQSHSHYSEPFEEWVGLKTALWEALQQGALVDSASMDVLDKRQPL
uniref:Uncharacterized protein n=1 Tax=Chromera velia CCMP2878 TaxID=1169474 RepID=A0A0G4HY88_9ALVE|eukprot:Cvel_33483.t1-p1 / transcript=Cvel_33483.t1 / gene=Cvel_33483 / organism=Chromera_velia_CCMP2878 / gene_product=hypothetical protein / transcript_product=hypothetical protein / location=Cvel_scaffold5448:3085-3810(+) / protein_length=242 / sequence_SO=supercontig / SO=protein_coding / is_pseudo=false